MDSNAKKSALHAAPRQEHTVQDVSADERQPLPRRQLFTAGLTGIGAALLAACSSSNFAGGNGLAKSKKEKEKNSGESGDPEVDEETPEDGTGSGDPTGSGSGSMGEGSDGGDGGDLGTEVDGADGPSLGDGTDTDSCHANTTTAIKTDDLPALESGVQVKFYGRPDSAMIAVHFTEDVEIDQLILTTKTGKMIALHGITPADKDTSGKFRPIVVDNVFLREAGSDVTEINVIVQTANGRKKRAEAVAWFNEFDGKPVVDLANGGAVDANISNWSVPHFDEGDEVNNFNVDATKVYPGSGGQLRNLYTVRSTTSYGTLPKLIGTITDIMGNVIMDIGGKSILEYQVFCAYYEKDGTYYRTIMHIA